MKVSVIVPVYNVSSLLKNCVESILSQGFESYEVILVDDGSTDASGRICDELEMEYDCIKTIHRENGGLSAARNTGIKCAQGDYIIFVDSDDTLCNNIAPKLVEWCIKDKLDVICANYCDTYEDGTVKNSVISPVVLDSIVNGKEALKASFHNNSVQMMVWMNIYRRELLIENLLFFPEGLNHEDEDWTPRVMVVAERVRCTDKVFYKYLHRSNSISKDSSQKKKNCLDLIKVCYRLKDNMEKWEDKELKILYEDYLTTIFLSGVSHGNLCEQEYRNLVNYHFFDSFHLSNKNKIKTILFKINVNLYCWIAHRV